MAQIVIKDQMRVPECNKPFEDEEGGMGKTIQLNRKDLLKYCDCQELSFREEKTNNYCGPR